MIIPSARKYAVFSAWSDTLLAAQLSEILGMQPDESWSVGEESIRAGRSFVRNSTSWNVGPDEVIDVSLEEQMESLLIKTKPALERIVPGNQVMGCGLVLVHMMSARDFQGHGITIEPEWTELLGRAGGSVILDQYIDDKKQD